MTSRRRCENATWSAADTLLYLEPCGTLVHWDRAQCNTQHLFRCFVLLVLLPLLLLLLILLLLLPLLILLLLPLLLLAPPPTLLLPLLLLVQLYNDGGIPMEPFHLRRERAEGYFDEGGNYIEHKLADLTDAWLESLEVGAWGGGVICHASMLLSGQ